MLKQYLLGSSVAAIILASGSANAIVIDNGVPSGTLGSFRADVIGGGQTRAANITALRADTNELYTGDVVYDYFTYLKIGNQGIQLPTFGESSDNGNVSSSGTVTGSNGNVIDWSVISSIAPNSAVLTNTFQFSSTSALGDLSLLQYLDEDVDGSSNDVFFTRGSIATNNLQLFTIDNTEGFGISHSGAFTNAQGLVNASFSGWAVDNYDDMSARLENGTQNISASGVFEVGPVLTSNPYVGAVYGPIDIVSVMGWTVDPNSNSATIITTLGGVPDITYVPQVPIPAAVWLFGSALAGLSITGRRRK
jgi:hypothetical protein